MQIWYQSFTARENDMTDVFPDCKSWGPLLPLIRYILVKKSRHSGNLSTTICDRNQWWPSLLINISPMIKQFLSRNESIGETFLPSSAITTSLIASSTNTSFVVPNNGQWPQNPHHKGILAYKRSIRYRHYSGVTYYNSVLILGLRPASERRRYIVTPSPTGCAQT